MMSISKQDLLRFPVDQLKQIYNGNDKNILYYFMNILNQWNDHVVDNHNYARYDDTNWRIMQQLH